MRTERLLWSAFALFAAAGCEDVAPARVDVDAHAEVGADAANPDDAATPEPDGAVTDAHTPEVADPGVRHETLRLLVPEGQPAILFGVEPIVIGPDGRVLEVTPEPDGTFDLGAIDYRAGGLTVAWDGGAGFETEGFLGFSAEDWAPHRDADGVIDLRVTRRHWVGGETLYAGGSVQGMADEGDYVMASGIHPGTIWFETGPRWQITGVPPGVASHVVAAEVAPEPVEGRSIIHGWTELALMPLEFPTLLPLDFGRSLASSRAILTVPTPADGGRQERWEVNVGVMRRDGDKWLGPLLGVMIASSEDGGETSFEVEHVTPEWADDVHTRLSFSRRSAWTEVIVDGYPTAGELSVSPLPVPTLLAPMSSAPYPADAPIVWGPAPEPARTSLVYWRDDAGFRFVEARFELPGQGAVTEATLPGALSGLLSHQPAVVSTALRVSVEWCTFDRALGTCRRSAGSTPGTIDERPLQ